MMLVRVVRKIFTAEVMGLLLVLAALQTLIYGISSSLRNTDTNSLIYIALFAALLCLGLGKSKLNGIQASVAITALGVIGVWILGARLASPLLDLANAVLSVIPQIVPALRSGMVIDTSGIAEAWRVIQEASAALALRVRAWTMGLERNVTINDALVRNMTWTLIVWLFAGVMGWFAGRRNAVASLLPSLFLLAAITSYSERNIEAVWLLALILILLMGVWHFKNHTAQWERRHMDYSESIRYDSGEAVIVLAVAIGALAFITPSISWREIRDFFRDRNGSSKNEAADLLGIRAEPSFSQQGRAQKPSLPREHLLSGGYAQSQKTVMTIGTGELPPIPNPSFIAEPARYYWRSVTYDQYVSAGWVTSDLFPQSYDANTPLIPGLLSGYRLVHLDVQMEAPEDRLFWSGILFSADIPFTADWRLAPQSSLFADQSALLQADMFAARANASSYEADAYIPVVSAAELRAASADYPRDIRERYLALPRSVPARVHALARDLTNGESNPYDKAKAIESYLRTNYPYDLEVPAPPEEQDVADYFLFDLKKGYCDYYATAMVVLARSSGLPARFVSGYSPGSYDAPNARYVIRELNAHSWAEIYFPEIGWIEFEPTASQPLIDRPETEIITNIPQNNQTAATRLLYRFRLERAIYWILPVMSLAFLSLIYFAVIERWWYLRWLAPAAAIERIYRGLYRLGRPLAGERANAETAHEFMKKLMDGMNEIKERLRLVRTFDAAPTDVTLLTELYQMSLFSRHHAQRSDAITALNIWKRLRWQLISARAIMLLRANPQRERKRRSRWNQQEAS